MNSVKRTLSGESSEPGLYSSTRTRGSGSFPARRRNSLRMPSVSGYMTAAAAASAALFFVLWWILQGEETPWVPAGLAASVVMLVAASALVVVMRREGSRDVREQDRHELDGRSDNPRSGQ